MEYLDRAQQNEFFMRFRQRISDGSLVWGSLEDSTTEFSTGTEKFSYFISSVDEDGFPPIRFEIWTTKKDDDGNFVADVLLQSFVSTPTDYVDFNLIPLYEDAQRRVLGADKVAIDILNDLSNVSNENP